jgi:hypothetical protein
MPVRYGRVLRGLSIALGAFTLISLAPLLLWDACPRLFPRDAHDVLAAVPLASIAVAYVVYEALRRPLAFELAKAIGLALAFVFWAANQLWPTHRLATLFNDIAIAAFVLDVFLVIVQRSRSHADEAGPL